MKRLEFEGIVDDMERNPSRAVEISVGGNNFTRRSMARIRFSFTNFQTHHWEDAWFQMNCDAKYHI